MTDALTTVEAAAVLGVSRQRVLQLIETGKLPASKLGRDWLLPRDAVDTRARR